MLQSLEHFCKLAERGHLAIEGPLVIDADQGEGCKIAQAYLAALCARFSRAMHTGLMGLERTISEIGNMESSTFRKWLIEQGCRVDHSEHHQRHQGHVMVTVHREERKTEVPLGGSHQIIDPRVLRRACEELGLDPARLPRPKSRV